MKELLAEAEHRQQEHLEFLQQMVNMESPTDDKSLVDKFVRFIAQRFEQIGGCVSLTPTRGFGDHLTVNFKGTGERPIMLLGHSDTVFPTGEVAKRPFRIKGDLATGPGVFDMKAGIAVMWTAIQCVQKVRGKLPNPLTVLITSDEEIGGASSQNLIESEARQARAVLVLEPSLPGGALKTARKGVGRFTIKSIGRASHAGINPSEGVNSIEEIAHQILSLKSIVNEQRGTTLTVGMIRGGTRPNVVPSESAIEVDARITSMDEARRITSSIHNLKPLLPGSKLEIRGKISRPPMERTSEIVQLFELAQSIARDVGRELKEGSTGGASDGNFTAALGIPTLDGLGPVGMGAHQIDEYIEIDQLPWRTALVAGLIERIVI